MSKYKLLAAILFAGLMMTSCTKKEDSGLIRFGMITSDQSDLKSTNDAYSEISVALVSIVGQDGNIIFEKELLTLYRFGSSWVTATLEVPAGEFQLTEFMLADSTGNVLWATPVAGSAMAHLVEKPLPIAFRVSPDHTTSLDVEVVRTGDHNPADFGYVEFLIGFVDGFCLKIDYRSQCMNGISDTTPGAPIYEPMLSISTKAGHILHEGIYPGLNKYKIPVKAEYYHLVVTDCMRDTVISRKYSLRELLMHRCSDNYRPLIIGRDSTNMDIVITPEGMVKPTIRQGIYGKLAVEVHDTIVNDTSVTAEYRTEPAVRELYIYPYSVMESIRTFAPMACYFPAGALPKTPVAVVRSNSDGFYQLALEAGEYLYLVLEGDQFYFDAFVSSHRPGHVMVYPEEISERNVIIVDCSMYM